MAAYILIATTKPEYNAFRLAIIVVGVILIVLPAIGINAAIRMMDQCAEELACNCHTLTLGVEGKELLPELQLSDRTKKNGMIPPRLMPVVFLCVWFVLGCTGEFSNTSMYERPLTS